ncbi:hypothetical protein HBI56_200410 [Parastagonospora nodorum]|uniref:Uncharacterized protein n=1 Tax=Phaeosphaeria nodorum (strain SN15 / ATCC MYA-4574 / FGSC 10173) TaxID=321614 RepID=A0A7U2EVL0_PHANO|nr:hypothetical protein HBH56_214950 [Parastagonospora nodorum]QRC93804.1 hypothetical protein JI435_404530 [Parastagonospora nodorum SN15]KAH3922583.1 hypothetical protein HBH54_222550 [Parastagonospora nodorum]KAH3942060.1 hypothetical protein HBH53_192460 [Parastagonospora nodorum]KAH3961312.1 hypothetical protein HBH51_183640 [Parastagonospora nodorum]
MSAISWKPPIPGEYFCTYQYCLYLILLWTMGVMTSGCWSANILPLHRRQGLPPLRASIARRIMFLSS